MLDTSMLDTLMLDTTLLDHANIISLKGRTDRLKNAVKELASIGVTSFTVSCGIEVGSLEDYPESWYNLIGKHAKAQLGCKLAHVGIVEKSRNLGFERVAIFEDDVAFEAGAFDALYRFEPPEDWELMYLGANHREEPEDIGGGLVRLKKSFATHAYVIRDSVYDFILENALESGVSFDRFLAENVHPMGRSYCFRPSIAYQKPGYSDILKRDVNYTQIRR